MFLIIFQVKKRHIDMSSYYKQRSFAKQDKMNLPVNIPTKGR